MATTVANPGSIVVPLSQIIEQLQGKLSTREIDALLMAIIAKRKTSVGPGDLITADLVNQMLSELADLEVRVTQLEGTAPTAAPSVVLIRPQTGEVFRIAQDLTIEGRNFGFTSGASVVKFDGVRATEYRPGSTDERMVVKIPDVGSLGADGKDVLLNVANATSSAERTIKLRPAQDLGGAVDVLWRGVNPATVQPGQAFTLMFALHSRANLDAEFALAAVVSRVASADAWNAATTLLNGAGQALTSAKLLVPSGGETLFQVRISPVPNVATGTTFALSVNATAGAVSGNTGRIRLAVGPNGVQLPDATTTIGVDGVQFFPANSGSFTRGSDADVIQVAKTSTARVTLVAQVKTAGVYLGQITPRVSPEAPTTSWTLVRFPQDPADPANPNSLYSYFDVTQAQLDAAGGVVSVTARFNVQPLSGASTKGEVEMRLERRNSGVSQGVALDLVAT